MRATLPDEQLWTSGPVFAEVKDTQTIHVPDDLYNVPRPTRPGQTFFLSSLLLSDNLSLLSLFEAKEHQCPTSQVGILAILHYM